MNRLRRYRGFGLVPLLLWLVMQTAMAGGMGMPSRPATESDDLSSIAICTPDGIRTVDLGHDGQPAAPAADHGCTWCQVFASLPPLPAPEAGVIADRPDARALSWAVSEQATLSAARRAEPFRSRAPPLSVAFA